MKTAAGRKSVAPFYYDRIEMAMNARHELIASHRSTLVAIAMRCDNSKPTEALISVDYIAQWTGESSRTVDRAIKVLVGKKLIRREVKGGWKKRRRTILNWALIGQGQFVYESSDKSLAAADAALAEFEPLTDDEVKILRRTKKPCESEDKGFDPEVQTSEEEEAARDAEVLDFFDDPGVNPVTEIAPVTAAVTKPPAPKKDTVLKPVWSRLTEEERARFDGFVENCKRVGAQYFDPDEFSGTWAMEYCVANGLTEELVKTRWKQDDGSFREQDCIRIALPLNEYASRRLSKHSGREVTPKDTAHLEKKGGADPYSILEYALVTPTWCDILKAAHLPAGKLMVMWNNLVEHWTADGAEVMLPPDEEQAA